MSGRWLTIIALSGCIALVAFALWQRARTTAHIRAFWGANNARLIQHAPLVKLGVGQQDWQDISQAPGLVHLRATLVDDRYYQWDELAPMSSPAPAELYRLRFEEGDQQIELTIEPDTGMVSHVERQQSVPLIAASAQAVRAYLKEIHRDSASAKQLRLE